MSELGLKKNKKAIIIVAHPDDEIIWMGGTILNNPQVDWTVYSVCRKNDTDREPKFRKVCKLLKVKGIITDLDDEDKLSLDAAIKKSESIIKETLKNKDFDILFTHGPNGEYGHDRHIAVHNAVEKLINLKQIKPEAVFYFDYKKNKTSDEPMMIPGDTADIIITLDDKILEEKKRIVGEMYGYPMDGIDVSLSTNPEVFKKLSI